MFVRPRECTRKSIYFFCHFLSFLTIPFSPSLGCKQLWWFRENTQVGKANVRANGRSLEGKGRGVLLDFYFSLFHCDIYNSTIFRQHTLSEMVSNKRWHCNTCAWYVALYFYFLPVQMLGYLLFCFIMLLLTIWHYLNKDKDKFVDFHPFIYLLSWASTTMQAVQLCQHVS